MGSSVQFVLDHLGVLSFLFIFLSLIVVHVLYLKPNKVIKKIKYTQSRPLCSLHVGRTSNRGWVGH